MYNMNLDTIMILQWFSKTACQASPKYNNHIKLIHIVLSPCIYALSCNFYEWFNMYTELRVSLSLQMLQYNSSPGKGGG